VVVLIERPDGADIAVTAMKTGQRQNSRLTPWFRLNTL
jgi:hypothetical protein